MSEERYVRVEVAVFARLMEGVLEKHDGVKGDTWKYCKLGFLEGKLQEEVNEYQNSEDPDELIDIANICMMIYNRRK